MVNLHKLSIGIFILKRTEVNEDTFKLPHRDLAAQLKLVIQLDSIFLKVEEANSTLDVS